MTPCCLQCSDFPMLTAILQFIFRYISSSWYQCALCTAHSICALHKFTSDLWDWQRSEHCQPFFCCCYCFIQHLWILSDGYRMITMQFLFPVWSLLFLSCHWFLISRQILRYFIVHVYWIVAQRWLQDLFSCSFITFPCFVVNLLNQVNVMWYKRMH